MLKQGNATCLPAQGRGVDGAGDRRALRERRHGDLVRLDVDNFGIGDVLIIVLDFQDDVYVAILVENADGNSADRAPDGAFMMSRAQRIHDLGDITPRVDDLTRYLHAFWCRGFSRRI